MSERLKNLLIAGVALAMAIALVFLVVTNESPDDRVERIGSSIKCPVCQGEAIVDSPAPMATDMMGLVEERVAQGATDEQIIDELLGSFSGAVLLDPPLSGATLILWLAPIAALLTGVAVVLWWKSHPGRPTTDERVPPTRTRRIAGAMILVGGLIAIVLVADALLQDRAAGPAEGAADVTVENLDDVSNETVEAVIAANLDNPQINGMRLALAERYFQAGDYRSAFPHFLQIAQDGTSTDDQATTALVRLGWMAFDGNGELDTAIALFDEALEVSPGFWGALYWKGQVLWCAGENDEAVGLFEQVLADNEVEDATRPQVEADLELAASGELCS